MHFCHMFLFIGAISVFLLKQGNEDIKSTEDTFVLKYNNTLRIISQYTPLLNSDTVVGSFQGLAFAVSLLPLLLAAGRKCGNSSRHDFGAQLEISPGGSSRCGPQQERPKSNQIY